MILQLHWSCTGITEHTAKAENSTTGARDTAAGDTYSLDDDELLALAATQLEEA